MTRRSRTWTEPEPRGRPLLSGDSPGTEEGRNDHRPPRVPRAVQGLTILTGLWLVAAPWVWGYGDTGGGFDARWNDVTIGLLVTAAGCTQLVRPARSAVAAVPVILGVWLAIAPFALAYNLGADPTAASLNDTIGGTLLTGLTVSGYLSARDAQRWDGHGSGP